MSTLLLQLLKGSRRNQLKVLRENVISLYKGSAWDLPQWIDPDSDPGTPLLSILQDTILDREQWAVLRRRPYQAFLLCASAYTRNLGLIGHSAAPLPEAAASDREPGRALYLWRHRLRRSRELIQRLHGELGINDLKEARAIADLCFNPLTETAPDEGVSDSPVPELRPRTRLFLAACLHCAEELHLGSGLFWLDVCLLAGWQEISAAEDLRRHCRVLGIGADSSLPGTMRVHMACTSSEAHHALKLKESKTQGIFRVYNRRIAPQFKFSAVWYDIRTQGYTPSDFRFLVDTSSSIGLLSGSSIYQDKRAFLRELVQNAVDACVLRKLRNRNHIPRIAIDFDESGDAITVNDNGIGMDREWIEKYFLPVGISSYGVQPAETEATAPSQSFISTFGIGFLSCFMVAEGVTVRTRCHKSPGMTLHITDPDDYFRVETRERRTPLGTRVELQLPRGGLSYSRKMEYITYLKTNVRFLPFPVLLTDRGKGLERIGCEDIAYTREGRTENAFRIRLRLSHSDGYLFLRAKPYQLHYLDLDKSWGGISLFQNGIFITQGDELLPEAARDHVVGRINLMGEEKCDLSLDRNRLFWTQSQKRLLRSVVLEGLARLSREFLQRFLRDKPPEKLRRFVYDKLLDFFPVNEVDDTVFQGMEQSLQKGLEQRFRAMGRIHLEHEDRKRVALRGHVEEEGWHEWQRQVIRDLEQSRPS